MECWNLNVSQACMESQDLNLWSSIFCTVNTSKSAGAIMTNHLVCPAPVLPDDESPVILVISQIYFKAMQIN